MSRAIHIIHLSDLHINPADTAESRPLWEGLCRRIRDFRQQNDIDYHLLVISGDLVDRGIGKYDVVERRIGNILTAANLAKDRVFIVPGNHDVCWKDCCGLYSHVARDLLSNPDRLENLDEQAKDLLRTGFGAFLDFTAGFPLQQETAFHLPGFTCAEMEINGLPLRLCGLNTALVAGPDDQGKTDDALKNRLAAIRPMCQMLDGERRLNLVVSHYPPSWIHEYERSEMIQRLQQNDAILFHGHIHTPNVDLAGVQPSAQLLMIGAGSLFGQKWNARHQCQVLALDAAYENPRLYQWVWFSNYGWRGFEPLELAWSSWRYWRRQLDPLSPPKPPINDMCRAAGVVALGNGRTEAERFRSFLEILDDAKNDSEIFVVGRSLVDWSLCHENIERAIENKRLNVKLALLDESSLFSNSSGDPANRSWIDSPVPTDWAMSDVPASMSRFRRIRVRPNTGSLEIFGLPFYLTHSFVAYTSRNDNNLHVLEEAGMSLTKECRPFIELAAVDSASYASSLLQLYRCMLIPGRRLLMDDGHRTNSDTSQRDRIISPKIRKSGLVDMSIGRSDIDWLLFGKSVQEIVDNTPDGREIFIVGRSLITWSFHKVHEKLAEAIVSRGLKCKLVIADPTDDNLMSADMEDYARKDLRNAYDAFMEVPIIAERLASKHNAEKTKGGFFAVYGIPSYVTTTFAAYVWNDGTEYATLEVGIGVVPDERPLFVFKHVSDNDMYTYLCRIHRRILVHRVPLIQYPREVTCGGEDE